MVINRARDRYEDHSEELLHRGTTIGGCLSTGEVLPAEIGCQPFREAQIQTRETQTEIMCAQTKTPRRAAGRFPSLTLAPHGPGAKPSSVPGWILYWPVRVVPLR